MPVKNILKYTIHLSIYIYIFRKINKYQIYIRNMCNTCLIHSNISLRHPSTLSPMALLFHSIFRLTYIILACTQSHHDFILTSCELILGHHELIVSCYFFFAIRDEFMKHAFDLPVSFTVTFPSVTLSTLSPLRINL